MNKTRLLKIEPNRKTITEWHVTSLDEINDYMGDSYIEILSLKNGDSLYVSYTPWNMLHNWFVCFDWRTEAFLPLRIYGPAFIGNGGLKDLRDAQVSIPTCRFFITFPHLKGGFIDGIQN